MSYLVIGLGNKAGDTAVSIQELLKLLVADDKPLSLSQGCLSCILPINQQALEYLNADGADRNRKDEDEDTHTQYTQMYTVCVFFVFLPSSGLG